MAEETVTGLSLTSAGLGLSHTQAWENSSLAASIDHTNLGPTLAALPTRLEMDQPFTGTNGQLIFRHKTSKTGILKAFANVSRNRFGLFMPGFSDLRQKQVLSLTNDHLFTQLSFRQILNDRWSMFVGGGFTQNLDEIRSDFALQQDENAAQAKMKFSYHLNDQVILRFGGEWIKSLW